MTRPLDDLLRDVLEVAASIARGDLQIDPKYVKRTRAAMREWNSLDTLRGDTAHRLKTDIDDLRAALQTAREDGGREEREAAVAWLRSDAAPRYWGEEVGGTEWTTAADALASGQHRPG